MIVEIKKNKEYPTINPGVGLIVRAAPQDRRKDDKANNFYIADIVTHEESVNGSRSYKRETKTLDRSELRELLDVGKKNPIRVI